MRETAFAPQELDRHGFLGERFQVMQPRGGYRSGVDTVLLAAACPVRQGDSVLDLGCGAGVAAFCLASRVPGVVLHGLEVQPGYAALAQANAASLGVEMRVHVGDVAAIPDSLKAVRADHVIANPPYYRHEATTDLPDAGKDTAFREDVLLGAWIACGLRRLRDGGWLTMVQRVERLPEILSALEGRAGDIAVKPIAGRANRPATRVLVRARKGGKGAFSLTPPFVMHDGEAHERDGEGFSAMAERVLRHGEAIVF